MDGVIDSGPHASGRGAHCSAKQLQEVEVTPFKNIFFFYYKAWKTVQNELNSNLNASAQTSRRLLVSISLLWWVMAFDVPWCVTLARDTAMVLLF